MIGITKSNPHKNMPVIYSYKRWKGIETPMKTKGWKVKKGIVCMAAAAMLLGLLPMTPANTLTVQAKSNTPSVTTYASKEQLMTAFIPGTENAAISTLKFGKDESGSTMTWYILGKDTGVEGDNIAIFATAPIMQSKMFWKNNNNADIDKLKECDYGGKTVSYVYATHYGISDIRDELKGLATNESYFSATERSLMNATKIKTWDVKSNLDYTVADKLYLLACEQLEPGTSTSNAALWAGSSDQIVLSTNSYWNSGKYFWLRTPKNDIAVWVALPSRGGYFDHTSTLMGPDEDPNGFSVRPAANLNLSSVLFASSVPVVLLTNDVPQEEILQNANPMTLRMDGSGKQIGTVSYNNNRKVITVERDDATMAEEVRLVIQGKNSSDRYYMVKLPETQETIYDFSTLPSTPDWLKTADLSECRIWLEMTEGGVTYAVNAEHKEAFQAPTVYAMNIGTAPLYKVSYGWNEAEGVQVSYGSESARYHVLDKDDESVLLHSDGKEAMPFASSGNQWSGSAAETWLNGDYYTTAFSELERSAIKSTTLSTRADYTIRRTNYKDQTAEDRIFLLSAYEADKLYEDACERKQDESWWLRSADSADGTKVATVNAEGKIESSPVTTDRIKVSPAFRLDLSAVLFTTAKDENKTSSVSERNEKAYTGAKIWRLTLKDDRKTIGVQEDKRVSRYPNWTIEVPYRYTDNASGEEKVNQISVMITDKPYEDEGAKIQYYGALKGLESSPESTGTGTFILPYNLRSKTLGTGYHLYLLAEHVSDAGATDYASAPYEITEFSPTSTLDISSIEVKGIDKPVAGEELDTEATCTTEHVSVKDISWTYNRWPATTAGYYRDYTANITLQADDGYAFNDAITSGTAQAKVVYIDAAGQEKVTYETIKGDTYRTVTVSVWFGYTEKDKLESIPAPEPLYVSNGTSWDGIESQLPKKIAIVTEGKSVSKEDVEWEFTEAKNSYEPSSTERQAFTLTGEVKLWNIEQNGVDCTVKMDVIVKAKDQVEEPKANPAGGSYTESQKVSLTSATEGAAIYYTMDGSDPALVDGKPDGNTKKYVTPVDVLGLEGQTVTITIKAIAVKEGMPNSEIMTYVYHINEPFKEIAEVVVTGIDTPAAGKALDTTADCATQGVSIQSVEWKTSDLNTGVTTAGYETSYAVLVKLKADDGRVFSPAVTGTVNGAVAGVKTDQPNNDGTITAVTVWIKFARTGKDKLVSITAPSSRIVKNGTAYENMGLPATVAIVTEGRTVTTAAVAWDTTTPAAGSYDPTLETEQTVTLNGTVTCPDTIDPNGVSLATTITITIRAIDATSHFITVSSGDAGSVSPDGRHGGGTGWRKPDIYHHTQ